MNKGLAIFIQAGVVFRTRALVSPGGDVSLPIPTAVLGLQVEPSATFFAINKVA